MDVYPQHVLAFLFALARISGLVFLAPLFGAQRMPWQARVLLAVAIAAMIAPVCRTEPLAALAADGGELLVAVCREVVLGLVLGTAMVLLVAALQAAGQLVGQMAGMSLAEVVDPASGAASGFGRLFELVGIAAFLLTGGHRQVLAALLDTFQWMPPGAVGFSAGLFGTLHQVAAESFQLALRAAAPVLLALLLSALVMGILHRLVPHLNTWSLGLSLNALAALALVASTLGGVAWTFQSHVEAAVQSMAEAVACMPSGDSSGGRRDE